MRTNRARETSSSSCARVWPLISAERYGLHQRRMAGEIEVVIAAERQVAAIIDGEVGPVRAFHRSAAAGEPGSRELVEPEGKIGHGGSLG